MSAMTIDPVAIIERFGVPVLVMMFCGWIVVKMVNSFVPKVAEAVVERIKAGTELTRETKAVVSKIPEVIAANGKDTREAIASFEKALVVVEHRITTALNSAVAALKEDLFDHRTERIDKSLARMSRHGTDVCDSDKPPPNDRPTTQ